MYAPGGAFRLPGTPKATRGGAYEKFRAARGPPLGRAQEKNGSPGGPFGRPEVALESLGAIWKVLKNHWFLYCFEPLEPSSDAKGPQKW